MKRLWIELQRWNNSRALVCNVCGAGGVFDRRYRAAGLAPYVAEQHRKDHPGHVVKVRRFG